MKVIITRAIPLDQQSDPEDANTGYKLRWLEEEADPKTKMQSQVIKPGGSKSGSKMQF